MGKRDHQHLQRDERITLDDGRTLAHAAFGDPADRPCLVVHGYGSSRLLPGWAFPAETLARHGLYLIAPDRPGYGRSTPNRRARFVDLAHDLVALTDHLRLTRFAVLGVSMGAGPAFALAATQPARVSGTTILSGMPSVTCEHWAPARRGDALHWALARHAPWLLNGLCALAASMVAKGAAGEPGTFIDRLERGLPLPDRLVLRDLLKAGGSPAMAAFTADVPESCVQGGRSMADDLRRHLRPWDFDPAAVTSPVQIWHGLDDPRVPVELVQRLAGRLSHAQAFFVPGGHFAPLACLDAVFAEITARP
ncbi:alpha/beta fold hydrolase [Streptosporangium roseum]|uniref:alpha/beta fold hydrolase n=1 Tax=Streptosporangium roseum TaxID=2001 RepID=UPI0004CCC1FA|nr:alpha/beta fold hydrolase [Streptosporangium roseum]